MITPWSLELAVIGFIVAIGMFALVGVSFVRTVDQIADQFKLGEAFVGGLFIGATTSIADTTVTLTSAVDGLPTLGISNAIGGIAAQTAFLALVDIFYRKSNLEHAAASVPNLFSAGILSILLLLPILAYTLPGLTFLSFHIISVFIIMVYFYGLFLVKEAHRHPMWFPRKTKDTREDIPEEECESKDLKILILRFLLFALITATVGWILTRSAESVIFYCNLSELTVGLVLTAIITSLPEFVIGITAIKRGALTLAIGNFIGGNNFDVLQLSLADFISPQPIYGLMTQKHMFLLAMTLMMSAVLILGLIRRQKRGVANIGLEGITLLGLYTITVIFLVS